MTEKYYIREDKQYYKCLQGVSNNKIIPNKVGNTSKNIFLGLSLCSLIVATLFFIIPIIANSDIKSKEAIYLTVKYLCDLALSLVYIFIVTKSHEHIHKMVLEKFGGKCKARNDICIETTNFKFTRKQYIKGLRAPLKFVLISGLLIFLLLFAITKSFISVIFIGAISWGCKICRLDIHDISVLLRNHNESSQVEMIVEKTSDKVYSGFKVYDK